jgi:CheY-like chemotaxis protein
MLPVLIFHTTKINFEKTETRAIQGFRFFDSQDRNGLMPRVLSISYDVSLLQTRALMLSHEGFEVESAVGFSAAIQACELRDFDLVIIGHSIPPADKEAIINGLRRVCATPVLALRKANESPLDSAEYNLDSGDPHRFLSYVKEITKQKTRPG